MLMVRQSWFFFHENFSNFPSLHQRGSSIIKQVEEKSTLFFLAVGQPSLRSKMSQYEVLGEGRTGAAVPGSTDNSPLLPTAITSTQEHHHVQAWHGTPRGKMLLLFGGFFLVIVALALAIGLTLGAGGSDPTLASAASPSAIMNTLNQFESFALSNGGSRSVGSAGYELSATYIESQLSATKAWNHPRQPFFGPVYTQYANPTLSLTAPFQVNFQLATDFSGMRYGGHGSSALPGGAVL